MKFFLRLSIFKNSFAVCLLMTLLLMGNLSAMSLNVSNLLKKDDGQFQILKCLTTIECRDNKYLENVDNETLTNLVIGDGVIADSRSAYDSLEIIEKIDQTINSIPREKLNRPKLSKWLKYLVQTPQYRSLEKSLKNVSAVDHIAKDKEIVIMAAIIVFAAIKHDNKILGKALSKKQFLFLEAAGLGVSSLGVYLHNNFSFHDRTTKSLNALNESLHSVESVD